MSGDGSPSWPIIQLLAANTPPGFSTRKISRKIASLSGTCSSASLEKTTSKAPSGNGSGPGGACTKSARSERPRRCARSRAAAMTGRSTSKPVTCPAPMLVDQMQRDAARAAADVEHALAFERQAGDDAVDLLRAAGRQIAVAPQRLEEADRRVVIFGRIDGACAHRRHVSRHHVPAQSLAHKQENATVFVEHSFNMAGQARLSCAKSPARERSGGHEELGCHRHRRRTQRAGQRLLSAARRPRRAGRREERMGRRRGDQPLADAGLPLFQLLLCLLAVPPGDHARPRTAALRAAGDLLRGRRGVHPRRRLPRQLPRPSRASPRIRALLGQGRRSLRPLCARRDAAVPLHPAAADAHRAGPDQLPPARHLAS